MESSEYLPPVKRALSDDALAAAVGGAHADEAGILQAMALLEEQTQLRASDDAARQAWISKMQALGTPEALHAIANADRVDEGLEPLPYVAPTPVVAEPETVVEAAVTPDVTAPVEDVPFQEPDQPSFDTPQPVSAILPTPTAEVASMDDFEQLIANTPGAKVASAEEVPSTTGSIADSLNALYAHQQQGSAEEDTTAFEEEHPIAQGKPAENLMVRMSQATPENRIGLASAAIRTVGLLALVPAVLLTGFLKLAFGNLASDLAAASVGVKIGLLVFGVAFVTTTIASLKSQQSLSIIIRAAFGVRAAAVAVAVLALSSLLTLSVIAVAGSKAAVAGLGVNTWQQSFSVGGASINIPVAAGLVAAVILVAAGLAHATGRFLRVIQYLATTAAACFVSLAILNSGFTGFATLQFDPAQLPTVATVAALTFGLFAASGTLYTPDIFKQVSSISRGWVKVVVSILVGFVIPAAVALVLFDSQGFALQNISSWLLANVAAASLVIWLLIYSSSNLASVATALTPRLKSKAFAIVLWSTAVVLSVFTAVEVIRLTDPALLFNARGYLTVASVGVASTIGIVLADAWLRRANYHEVSLYLPYGHYRAINPMNLVGFVLATALGLGFVSTDVPELAWVGYLARITGAAALPSQLGILMAFGLALLIPVVSGIPRIRKQEREVTSVEERRTQLLDVSGINL